MRMRKLASFVVASMVAAIPACAFAGEVNVSVDVGNHGSVNDHSEDYSENVDEDSTYDLKIRAEDGYEIHTVLINDEPVADLIADPVEGQKEAEITLGDVGSDVDISAVFRAAETDTTAGDDNDSGDGDGDRTDEDGGADTTDESVDEDGKNENDNDDGDNNGEGADLDGNKTDENGATDGNKTDENGGEDGPGDKADENGSADGNKSDDNDDKTDGTADNNDSGSGNAMNDASENDGATDPGKNDDIDVETDGAADGSVDSDSKDAGGYSDSKDAGGYSDSHDTGSPKTGDTAIPIPFIVTLMLWAVLMVVGMSIIRRRS